MPWGFFIDRSRSYLISLQSCKLQVDPVTFLGTFAGYLRVVVVHGRTVTR